MKEASGNADRVSQLAAACGEKFTILSGDDSLTLAFMAVGAKGVISVASGKFSDAAGNFNTDGAEANNTVTLSVNTVTSTFSVANDSNALAELFSLNPDAVQAVTRPEGLT